MLTRETPLELLSYAECDSFPTTSTIDQFFHTAQFKAYRDLGRHNARQVIEGRAAVTKALAAAPTWQQFQALAALKDAHWAVVTLQGLLSGGYEYGTAAAPQLAAAASQRSP